MKTQKSVSDLLFPNQYRRKVLGLLLMKPGQWIHLRELARMTGAVPGTLKKEVDALCDVGLLQSQRIGNQTQFSANTAHPVYPELQALINKTIGLADALRASLLPLADKISAAFVFGSIASSNENANSDIDVMIIGEVTFAQAIHALYDAQNALGREINPKVMRPGEWLEKKSGGNTFVQDVMAKPKIMLIGDALGL
ncbi:nucleotidyltransferase domain-containing protein [Rhodoferax sp.]|uniref:nucleotidyltransferase domain-containing protein n=2 Tax=Comamonadaceae TaxID=80864 RepID=UPI00271F6A26|nr:nucleotidyltransferase domain-containing protein [Rhodoferax sp.]MDO9144086.1 nucleotidyltransferase domain-containing protein [Rhodoferax sp.]MDP1531467.1 nucleotidyltransferase domain-containing protein [Rhodoferax sp.]MDP1944131.1 nucleotidyltransferase domain-containing protein [Rhodoferax sp.]MDP2442041.1 nucleotidyltransferase domain-containing protein [Rhodoferax sp.]MDP3191578.1 nucleotidyltransferase domain-containing protein [Rhodoferax sp.]